MMRKIAIACISLIITFMFLSSCASPVVKAKKRTWQIIGNSVGILSPREDVKIYLEASINYRTKGMSINLLDNTQTMCKAGKSNKRKQIARIKINGKSLKVISKCVNGRHYILPETAAGKSYLNSAVASGQGIVIDTGFSPPLHYPGTDLKALRDKLISEQSAMDKEG
ncbi:MAG: hypothetical protein P8Z75_10500 [Gammaproteobacteria bacterium]|jgi:hypothetical protein